MTGNRTLFEVGHVIRTPAALEALCDSGVPEASLLARHRSGDFGDVTHAEADSNLSAIANGGRVFSAYRIAPDRMIWVITDADRTMTTLLRPADYEQRFPALYELRFRSLCNQRRGLTFPCDATGRVDLDALGETALKNYLYARAVLGHEYAYPQVVRVNQIELP